MKADKRSHIILSFLAICSALGTGNGAASTLELNQTPQEISGIDSESGVVFQATLPDSNHVVIDATVNAKRIHGEIDYARRTLRIRSFSEATGASITLSAEDIVAFKKLLVSLPSKISTESLHGDALSSLINLVSSAPAGHAIDIVSSSASFTTICSEIGGSGVAVYKLETKTYRPTVNVGPVCYIRPALGRCGAGGGPDPGIGLVQRFTQECLNHDQCCVATKSRKIGPADVCGNSGLECVPEFYAAASGFFFAPDCGTTAGDWTDDYGYTYTLKGGESSGKARDVKGSVQVPPCGTWSVTGTRTGTGIVLTATNPSGASDTCAASYTYTGTYNDCNTAGGSWNNTSGLGGAWSWNRTNTVNQTIRWSRTQAGPRPADK